MAGGRQQCLPLWSPIWIFVVWIFAVCPLVLADNTRYVTFNGGDGTVYLDDNRRPSLYTGDFGDCQGDSLINVTRFDASMYRDNMTVMLHMSGTTALQREHVMLFLSVYAYGESRFNLTFNPCVINIPTMCPLNSSIPIEANGLIPIGPSDVANIPSIAFQIPDFEGQAILRIFSNTTESQIACYSAVLKNGNTFSHPSAVGSIVGLFTFIALVSSVTVAIYGQLVPEMRMHYAHSVSIFVTFSILQHVFFSGGLSMNWPSVLVAWWSNFGWSAGMIYSKQMQNTINQFIGSNRGNISMVGSAPSNQNFANLGGGYQLSQLYKRSVHPALVQTTHSANLKHMLQRRSLVNSTDGFSWYGSPVAPGLPLPGNYSGFAGTLGQLQIPASNAFMTGLLWFLSLVAIVAVVVVSIKWITETFVKIRLIKTTRLDYFRSHWVQFTTAAILRTFFIAFFMMTYLALFQFVLGGSRGVIAVAATVFALFLIGMFGAAAFAVWYRLHQSKLRMDADKLQVVSRKHGLFTWYGMGRESSEKVNESTEKVVKNFRWWHLHFVDQEGTLHVHDDENYTTKFGWLSARFRRSKWWFFSAWLVYELGRACFYGGAAGHPLIQVFGLLAWEILGLVAIVIIRPFESNRLNLLMVYLLGFSKVATVALSCAFDPRFRLSRVFTTVIGVVIIVIQGVLMICLMIAILLGAISSYLSITRDHDEPKSEFWTNMRIRYFAHIQQKATDKPRPPPPPPPPEPEKPKEPYFSVGTVRREPKIEDEDPDSDTMNEVYEVEESPERDQSINSPTTLNNPYLSRGNSVRSRTSVSNLPYGARAHRRSWSVRDLPNQSTEQIPSGLNSRMSVESIRDIPMRYRAASMKDLSRNNTATPENSDLPARGHRRTRSTSNQYGPPSRRRTAPVESNVIRPILSREEQPQP